MDYKANIDNVINITNKERIIKDSGERYVNEKGGQRDADEGKFDPVYIPEILVRKFAVDTNYLEIFFKARDIRVGLYHDVKSFREKLLEIVDMLFLKEGKIETLEKLSIFLEIASKKYDYNNWLKLNTKEDFYRFRRSLCRHAYKCLMNYTDEPHHEAIIFNAVCLLNNFGDKEIILGVDEPIKYSLKGKTDIALLEKMEEKK